MKGQVVFVPAQPKPKPLNATQVAIVQALSRYFALTAEHVCRLFYAETSLSFVKEQMRQLVVAGYADDFSIPRSRSRGNLPFVYRLGPEGLKLLRDFDEDVPRRLRRSEEPVSEIHIRHTLA